ncbi:MAG: hypothetical protein A2Y38_13880 [Spirochaetes bacterium GWB1_59_5]|nr:MAG: hypothetical protein A2Y38_13880 [Spirochaetes bacterium GWB1_59_5]
MAMLVRLKPYDAKRGILCRRYTVFGHRFDESRGWYKVPDEWAKYVKDLHQDQNDPDSPMLFDVVDEAGAKAMEEAERKKLEERAKAADPAEVQVTPIDAVPTPPPTTAPPARRPRV